MPGVGELSRFRYSGETRTSSRPPRTASATRANGQAWYTAVRDETPEWPGARECALCRANRRTARAPARRRHSTQAPRRRPAARRRSGTPPRREVPDIDDCSRTHRLIPEVHRPVNSGCRFAKNADTPSWRSALSNIFCWAAVDMDRPASRGRSWAASTSSLASLFETGPRETMVAASSRAPSNADPSPITRFTRPQASAWSSDTVSPVNSICFARAGPIRRVNRTCSATRQTAQT